MTLKRRHYADEFRAEFWSYVDQSAGPRYCWPWMGKRSSEGYGYMENHGLGRFIFAPTVAHDTTFGPPPGERYRCHECGVAFCVNPWHIRPGTNSFNIREGYFHREEAKLLSLHERELESLIKAETPWYRIAEFLDVTPIVIWRHMYGKPRRRLMVEKVGGIIPETRYYPPEPKATWLI